MTDIRDLQLLVSLARHGHFSRAADDCGISQPAFSARVRKMEDRLGLPLVRRGNKFMGFTTEGEVVLKWARKLLADAEGMRQEIDALSDNLSGRVALGVIPTALPFAARVAARLRARHDGVTVEVHSLSTGLIGIRLNDFSLDAGIMYHADADPETTEKLYAERYVVIAPPHLAPEGREEMTWQEAAALPLSLLTRDMRNRQFIDDVFRRVGAVPAPLMEANGFTAVLAHVANGSAATIAPQHLAETFFAPGTTRQFRLVGPEVSQWVGMSIKEQNPVLPLVAALRRATREVLEESGLAAHSAARPATPAPRAGAKPGGSTQ